MATPTPWGNEFLVNSIVIGHQQTPAIARLANGGFVATWEDESAELFHPDIHAQVFHADGSKLGAEFLVNTTTIDNQVYAQATGLADGRFVITWTDISNGADLDVRAQIFNADGTRSGGEFNLATQPGGDQTGAVVTALPDGRFAAAWRYDDPLTASDIHGHIFNPDGTRSGGEFLVTSTASNQGDATITALSGGRFVVAWDEQFSVLDHDIRAQIFNADGSTSGPELIIGDSLLYDAEPSITPLANGGFVAAWSQTVGGISDIRARTFDPAGSASGPEFTINTTTVDLQFSPTIAALPDGRFVAAWGDLSQTGGDPSKTAIRAQVFNPDGQKAGAEFLVNSTTPFFQDEPSISVLQDGRFVVGWTDGSYTGGDQKSDDVRAQIFDPRTSAVHLDGTALDDDWIGTSFNDTMEGAGGADHLQGAGGHDVLSGQAGNDMLIGGLGHDTLDGGEGDDTAVIAQSLGQSAVIDLGDRIVVVGPDGFDTLKSIEHLQFTDGTVSPNDGNPLFDTVRYMNQNLDVFHAGANALDHFNTFGWHEGRDPNAFFSVNQYLDANPDVKASGANPLEHYHQTGWHEGRDPSAWFDTKLYLTHNPDVAAMGVDPLEHFLQHGISEGRSAYAAIGDSIVGGFDAQYYLMNNRDVAAAGVDPLLHYQMFGWHEGRNADGWFDSAGYLAHYADVAAAGVNPLEHYLQFGWKEGRDPSAAFDTLGYLAANPDVAAAGVNPLEHFLTFGAYEGRAAVNDGVWH